jgi:glutathione S-transferase
MKLYYARGACSLSNRISLHEAGIAFADERVDLQSRTTEAGRDFLEINPKGYVPLLVLEGGEKVTENIAILSLIAERSPHLLPDGELGRIRMLEALSFISGELHIAFKPLFHRASVRDRKEASERISGLLNLLAQQMEDKYLLGHFTVADAYLFVILLWARKFEVSTSEKLADYFELVAARPSVRRSLEEESLMPGEAPAVAAPGV